MYTKEQLKKQVENMGLTGEETILIHSSMKSIGEVEGGADTVLDAWIEYFGHGLLLLPTHTWKNINADSPVYNPKETPSCVGLLTNMFLKRDGVIRSLHPTHSMAGIGKKAAEYLAGEENSNTFIHSVEEVLNVPHRLSDKPMKLQIVMPDGSIKDSYMRKHYNADQPHISEDFVKLNQAFLDCKAVREVTFGDAECLLCDAQAVFEVVRHVIAPDPECIVTSSSIPKERWEALVK